MRLLSKYAGSASAIILMTMTIGGTARAASDAELADIKKQIEALVRQRAEDDRHIRELEDRLLKAETAAKEAQVTAAQASAAASAPPPPPPPSAPASANAFNPAISVVMDGKFGNFSKDPDTYGAAGFPLASEGPGQRGLFLGEAEINAQSNIDDLFMGSVTFSLAQDGPNTNVGLEEAFIQTLTLPYGLQATAGKMLSDVGYINSFHSHADDFADRPLAYRTFLADEVNDVGVRLTWLAPTDTYLRLGGEIFRGESFPAAGAADSGAGAKTVYLRVGNDIGTEISYQAGASWLWGDARSRETGARPDVFDGSTDVGIAHLVVKWAPGGNAVSKNLKFQTEVFREHLNGSFNGLAVNRIDYGAYAQLIYQFMPQWRVGYRFDWLSAGDIPTTLSGSTLDGSGHDPTRQSVMVEYNHSEFSRLRLQYNYDRARLTGTDNEFLLQYTVTLGAHPAHSY